MAAVTAPAAASGLSPCASFVEESLILPGRNPGLFLRLVALLFAHTFVFLSLAVRTAHPAVLSLLSLPKDAPPQRRFNGFGGCHRYSDYYYPSATGGGGDEALEHGKTLLLVYLAYLASKLAAQVAVALAASATARGGRPGPLEALRGGRVRSLAAAAAFLAALELASTALLAACLAAWWTTTYNDSTAMAASFVSGALLFLLLCVAVPARLCLAAAVPLAISAVASSTAPDVRGGPSALRRAWRLMAARERRKEAAVLVVAAGLLPVVAYPVYAFALTCGQRDGVFVLLAMLPGYLFPSVAVQLYSTVAAAVFYHRFGGHHEPAAAIPLTTATKAIAS